MDWDFIWKAVLIVLAGTLLLRIAGRKTVSQMTLAETVIMIAIGSLLITPVAGKNIWTTLLVGAVLVLTLIVLEYLQLKSDRFEKLLTGKAKIVIDNGTVNEKNLVKLRLSVDQLEMKLRQMNVTNIGDVQYATLEPNGQLGLTLKVENQPVTKKEFQQLKELLVINNAKLAQINEIINQQQKEQGDIFTEVKNQEHKNPLPQQLQ